MGKKEVIQENPDLSSITNELDELSNDNEVTDIDNELANIDEMTKEPEPEIQTIENVTQNQWFKITTTANEYSSRKLPDIIYRKGQNRYTQDIEEVKLCMVNAHFKVVKVTTEEATTAPLRPKASVRPGSRRN